MFTPLNMTDRSVIFKTCVLDPKLPAKRAAPAARRAGRGAAVARSDARAAGAAERRAAILKAALDEFSERGFAAARLDDVARRAGVAKGTIYLHFKDKEALFQELVRFQIGPVVGALEGARGATCRWR